MAKENAAKREKERNATTRSELRLRWVCGRGRVRAKRAEISVGCKRQNGQEIWQKAAALQLAIFVAFASRCVFRCLFERVKCQRVLARPRGVIYASTVSMLRVFICVCLCVRECGCACVCIRVCNSVNNPFLGCLLM